MELAGLARIELLFHEQILAGIDHGLHHHVGKTGLFDQLDDFFAVGDAGGHRHGAGDMFAGLESLDAHPTVVGNGRVDVDGVDAVSYTPRTPPANREVEIEGVPLL